MKNVICIASFLVLQLFIISCNTQPNELPANESDTTIVNKETKSNNQDSYKSDNCIFFKEFTQAIKGEKSNITLLDKTRIAEYAYTDIRGGIPVDYCNTKIYEVSLDSNVFSKFFLKKSPNEQEITLKSELANCVRYNGIYITTDDTSRPTYQIDVCLQVLIFKDEKSAMKFYSKFNQVKGVLYTSMPSCAIQSEKVIYVLHTRSVQFNKYMESIRDILEELKSKNIIFN